GRARAAVLRRGRRAAARGPLGGRGAGLAASARLPAVAAAEPAPPRGPQVRGLAHIAVSRPPKLVLTVIDGLKPAMLERAIALGRAPTLARIAERGAYVDDCVAAFPSVTPVCA